MIHFNMELNIQKFNIKTYDQVKIADFLPRSAFQSDCTKNC